MLFFSYRFEKLLMTFWAWVVTYSTFRNNYCFHIDWIFFRKTFFELIEFFWFYILLCCPEILKLSTKFFVFIYLLFWAKIFIFIFFLFLINRFRFIFYFTLQPFNQKLIGFWCCSVFNWFKSIISKLISLFFKVLTW